MTIYDIDQREVMILDRLFKGQIELMAARISLDHLYKVRDAILKGEIFQPREEIKTIEQVKVNWPNGSFTIFDDESIQQLCEDLADLKKRSGLVPSRLKEPPSNMKDEEEESGLLRRSEVSIAYRPIDIYPEFEDVWCGKGWYLVEIYDVIDTGLCQSGPFESYDKAEKEFYSLPE